jgi:hypothetical protein
MAYLIDGYNLLHVTGIFGRGRGPRGLERSRKALLNFLAASLAPSELSQTTIVFDAAGAPPGLPQSYRYEGMQVEFARDPGNADELLERLIAAHDTPRKLVVVSGDHRIQRAARRRRSKAVDSDRWWAKLCLKRRVTDSATTKPQKPTAKPSSFEVDYWVEQFTETSEDSNPPRKAKPHDELESPFPPGYADDLLEEE